MKTRAGLALVAAVLLHVVAASADMLPCRPERSAGYAGEGPFVEWPAEAGASLGAVVGAPVGAVVGLVAAPIMLATAPLWSRAFPDQAYDASEAFAYGVCFGLYSFAYVADGGYYLLGAAPFLVKKVFWDVPRTVGKADD